MLTTRWTRPALLAALLASAASGCSQGNGTAAPAIGDRMPFHGEVDRSAVITGARRFSSGAQGVWFRLGDGDPSRYNYFPRSIEEGIASGVMARQADGEIRFVDLAGRRVEGVATVRSEVARDVVTLRVEVLR